MKERKAGVAIGGWDWAPAEWEEAIGSVGGEDMVAREDLVGA